jgi:prolyl-tRNA synthetase
VYLDPEGKEKLIVMGCYGIGVGRTAAAAIEQNHDDKGILWPLAIAAVSRHRDPLRRPETPMFQAASEITDALQKAGVEVLLDDRPTPPASN